MQDSSNIFDSPSLLSPDARPSGVLPSDNAATHSDDQTQQPITSEGDQRRRPLDAAIGPTIRVFWRCDKELGDPACTNKERPGLHGGDKGRFEMLTCSDPSYALETAVMTEDELFERSRMVLQAAGVKTL